MEIRRPEKKDVFGTKSEGGTYEQQRFREGFNQSYDQWEAYHKEVEDELKWWHRLIDKYYHPKKRPSLKAYVEQLQKIVENLPTAGEMEKMLDEGFRKCITSSNKYGIKDLATALSQRIGKCPKEEKK